MNNEERALKAAVEELKNLEYRQRGLQDKLEEVTGRIARIRGMIDSLSTLLEEKGAPSPLDFGEAVRHVLRGSRRALTSQDIGKALDRCGYDLSGLSDPIAAIEKVVIQLCQIGEVQGRSTPDATAYTWIGK